MRCLEKKDIKIKPHLVIAIVMVKAVLASKLSLFTGETNLAEGMLSVLGMVPMGA